MHLTRLELVEFRLYRAATVSLEPTGITITGDNGSGKSTIVEAVALLATMRSPRTGSDRELINLTSGRDLGFPPYARAIGDVHTNDGPLTIEIGLQLEDDSGGPLRKMVQANGRSTKVIDAVGLIKVVLFAPEDVALASGPPSHRRRYLDLLLSQIDRGYVRALARYNRVLEQRNSLLRQLGKTFRPDHDSDATTQLTFWDEELVSFGSLLIASRLTAVARLAELSAARFAPFGAGRSLAVAYTPSVGGSLLGSSEAQPTIQAKAAVLFAQQLVESRRDDLRRGVTLFGPHRDDVSLRLDGMEVGTFGSRGQQRLVVISLKLAEASLMTERAGDPPVVLLDDVLSELDLGNRELLLDALSRAGDQVIVTAADPSLISGQLGNLPRVHVHAGSVQPLSRVKTIAP